MGACGGNESRVRLLALGNDLLADDAFGPTVAREVRRRVGNGADIVVNGAAGFQLFDDVLGVDHLVVVDTIETGTAAPGVVREYAEEDLRAAPVSAPHGAGILDVLACARALGLPAARKVTFIAVEAADCSTVGGRMHPAVAAAAQGVADRVQALFETGAEKASYA
jgi:hydrogenase maturation protease